jgi:4-diphosphocytidyl-2-C-methyl-D-erythritol kinase
MTRATVKALAKVNLSLEVLNKRPDGYHNLRTVFHTISLADTITIEYTKSRTTRISIDSEIPDNLAVRAATAALDAMKVSGQVRMTLKKVIPMGGGLGGGSSDAAAVLLALPVLAAKAIPLDHLMEIGAGIGSDVPFFLLGGCALGLDRGTELYPLPDAPLGPGILVSPQVHVSTAEAYRALNRGEALTPAKLNISRSLAISLGSEGWSQFCHNDFEPVVFRQHAQLNSIRRRLQRLGASPARMSGSGAAIFGIFPSEDARSRALLNFTKEKAFPVTFVSRRDYHALWWRQLREHICDKLWPPRSRYVR